MPGSPIKYPGVNPPTVSTTAGDGAPGVIVASGSTGIYPTPLVVQGHNDVTADNVATGDQALRDAINWCAQHIVDWPNGGNYSTWLAAVTLGSAMTWVGPHVFSAGGGGVVFEGNDYHGSGHNFLTAGTAQFGGAPSTPLGSAPWCYVWCTANSVFQADGIATFNDTATFTGPVAIGAGPFSAGTAIDSEAVLVGATLTTVFDCSKSNTFWVGNTMSGAAAWTFSITNAASGYHGRIYFSTTNITTFSLALTLAGATVIKYASATYTGVNSYYVDFQVVVDALGVTFLLHTIFST